MTTYEIAIQAGSASSLTLPGHLLSGGGQYRLDQTPAGITLTANRDGLLYLAEILVQLALAGLDKAYHVHLRLDSRLSGPNVDAEPELTIFAAQE